jgi:hypothetical protein
MLGVQEPPEHYYVPVILYEPDYTQEIYAAGNVLTVGTTEYHVVGVIVDIEQ